MKKYLLILEVSQKQAFIFKSLRLRNNIAASDIIRYVTDSDFFKTADSCYSEEENMVYSGGGHSVLAFETRERAREFAENVSRKINSTFPDIEMFMKITEIKQKLKNSENIKELIRQLEVKKSLRKASFSQENFGFEVMEFNKIMEKKDADISGLIPSDYSHIKEINDREEKAVSPYKVSSSLQTLGGTKGESNFIAVVHIDGNKMGARVADFDSGIEEVSFDEYAEKKKLFSESIDRDFTDAYFEMIESVKNKLEEGALKDLDISSRFFPVRRVVMAGDDICFVTEGRIGIECAAEYIRVLSSKKNSVDGKRYSACAGVAIVHQKYPFYKAYKLAENLCDNAKKAIADRDKNSADDLYTSAIDWHIEFGEIYGSVSDRRKQDNELYRKKSGLKPEDKNDRLSARPYIICSDNAPSKDESYDGFISMLSDVLRFKDNAKDGSLAARGKLKKLRNVLKNGRAAAVQYSREARIDSTIDINNRTFDALEIMDTFIRF